MLPLSPTHVPVPALGTLRRFARLLMRQFFRRWRTNTVRRIRRRARRSCRRWIRSHADNVRRGRTYVSSICKWCPKKCATKRDGTVAYTCGWEHCIWSIRQGDFGPNRCPCRYKHNDAGKVGSRPRKHCHGVKCWCYRVWHGLKGTKCKKCIAARKRAIKMGYHF